MTNPLNKKGIFLWDSFKEKVIPEYTGEGEVIELKPYILPKPMFDTELQKEVCNTPISVNDFITTISFLIEKQSKGEKGILLNNGYCNIFHVKLKDGAVVVSVRWRGGEWDLDAFDLDYDYRWFEDNSFFAPATETLPSESPDTLTLRLHKLEERVEKLLGVIKI